MHGKKSLLKVERRGWVCRAIRRSADYARTSARGFRRRGVDGTDYRQGRAGEAGGVFSASCECYLCHNWHFQQFDL